jgi:predicted transcriptional regulator YdeE
MSRDFIAQKLVKDLGEVKLVGIRVVCAEEKYIEEIPKAAKTLKERTNEIKNVLYSGQQVGAFIVEESSLEEDGYWVCVQVDEFKEVPKDMSTLTVPPHKYATILHNGPNYLIKSSYEELHQWIAIQGLKRSNKSWNLEFYLRDNQNPNNVRVELFDSIID